MTSGRDTTLGPAPQSQDSQSRWSDDPSENQAPQIRLPHDPDETLDAHVTPPSGPPANEPRQVDRFRLEKMLGQGGMGQVWEAWDPKLERQIAIKLLLTADLGARRRFLREARLQATIAHPGICPVFEVGQEAGEPYLVMPRLEGSTLDLAVDGSPLEYKLGLMRQVAEAVHAAHQQGLIHRDLKPANILVETTPDSPPRPIILDFGIARSLEGEELTASGEILGTPAFMAPEQIEGQSQLLDRRTDVYALGATLYRLLTGQPPHTGEGTPLLFSIMHEEPARLPAGEIPTEVEAIVFKCLEKEKDQRYDSARQLAEDLGRHLADEPVQARPVTRWIRFGKWMRRHRVAVRATSAAAMVALAALAWGGWSAWRSEERQGAARRFGAQVEEIEALARYSHLVPLHDVREDKKRLRERLDAIRPSLDDRDPVVRSLASHAMGRGHLALNEFETAREYLEKAYELAPDNSEIAADLGRTLSELYRDRLTLLERTRDSSGWDSVREQLSRQLASTFGKTSEQQGQWQRALEVPALSFLTKGRAPGPDSTAELEALILFHEGKPESALEALAAAPPAPAWEYGRLRLEGDILRSWGANLAAIGDADIEARLRLQEARSTYGRALAVAPSHSALLLDDAQTVALLVQMGLVPFEDVEALIEKARGSLSDARRVNPEAPEAWLWTARLERAAASHRFNLARDPNPLLAKSFHAARHALSLAPQSSSAWLELAHAHEIQARWLVSNGEDPSESFERAIKAFDRVDPKDRNYFYHVQVGNLHSHLARKRADSGLGASEAYDEAIAAYRLAAELHSAPFAALNNLALSLFHSSSLEGMKSHNMLTKAIEILGEALQLRSDEMATFYYLGLCRMRLAQDSDFTREIVNDVMAELAQADFERAIELAPEAFQPWVGLGELFHLRALASMARGNGPTLWFSKARQAYGRALELAPDQPIATLNLAWTVYFEGKYALRSGLDAKTKLAEAEELCRRSVEIHRRPKTLLCMGSVWRMQAEYYLALHDLEATADLITACRDLFEEILDLDVSHAEAHRSLGRLSTLEAQRLREQGRNPLATMKRARSFLDRSLHLRVPLADFHFADARWHLEKASWLQTIGQDASEAVLKGQLSLDKALAAAGAPNEALRLQAELDAF